MRPYQVHEEEIELIKLYRSLSQHERDLVKGVASELAAGCLPVVVLPSNVLRLAHPSSGCK